MKESISNERNIDNLKPNMKTLDTLDLLKLTSETVITAKLDGEFTLLSYTKGGETYTLNKWGHKREDFPALNQFTEAMNKTPLTHVEMLCELYAQENGKPANLPTFLRYIKGKDKKLDDIHIGIWDLIKIDGYTPQQTYAWKLEEVERWLQGYTLAKVVPYIKPHTIEEVKNFWRTCVEEKGYEGLVIRNGDDIYKIKPCLEVDAVIIGINKKSGNGKDLDVLQRKEVRSIKLAVMQPDGSFVELSDCASGINEELGKALFKLLDFKVGEDDTTIYVKPLVVCTVQYTDTFLKERQVLKFEDGKYAKLDVKPFVSLRHPRLTRFRPDKTVNPQDLRTQQIPEGKPLQYTLYQGDCRKVLPLIRAESIDLIITSPPYWKLYEYSGIEGEIGTKGTIEEYVADMITVFKECYRLLKPNGLLMLNMDNGKREDGVISVSAWEWIKPLQQIGFNLIQTIIWTDTTRRPLYQPHLLDHHYEPIFILAKGKGYTWNWQQITHHGDVWNITHYKGYAQTKADEWDRTGVATFPVALIEDLIKLGSNEAETVLDPFAGSGTVLDVAQRLNRNSIAIEISPAYCQAITQRCFNKNPNHKYTIITET
jgi:DNA modification methylase